MFNTINWRDATHFDPEDALPNRLLKRLSNCQQQSYSEPTSFPGFSPTRPTERVGENLGNEVDSELHSPRRSCSTFLKCQTLGFKPFTIKEKSLYKTKCRHFVHGFLWGLIKPDLAWVTPGSLVSFRGLVMIFRRIPPTPSFSYRSPTHSLVFHLS